MNRGAIALILSFTVIVVLTILGGAGVMRSVSESRFANRYLESTQAFWLAEAGVNRALDELRTNYNITSIPNTSLGSGGYLVAIAQNADGSRTVTSRGFIPSLDAIRAERILEVVMDKLPVNPPNFYNNAIYTSADVILEGNSFDVLGDVRYASSISGATERIDGSVTLDSSTTPLTHLDFDELRQMSQTQGNYYSGAYDPRSFPKTFWYDVNNAIPNIVFVEGDLQISGNVKVGGFYIVGGDVVYDASVSGNVRIEGAIYTLGQFSVLGGGQALNIDGGIWAGETVKLAGNVKVSYNSNYMSAIQNLGLATDVQITSWRDTQNPYTLVP